MPTTFLLIRHAATDAPANVLAGRAPNVHLSVQGRLSADRLAQQLSECAFAGVWSSPLERAVETATSIAKLTKAPIHLSENLNEVDYGEWTGMTFEKLSNVPAWHDYNTRRELTRIPSGEIIGEVRARVLLLLGQLRNQFGGSTIAIITHAEVIRVVLHHYLGTADRADAILPIDLLSVSFLQFRPLARVLGINCDGSSVAELVSYSAEP